MRQSIRKLFKKELVFLYGLAGLGMLGHAIFKPVLPLFVRKFGATGFEVGLLTSGFMIARAFTSVFTGKVIDKGFSGRLLIRIGIGAASIFILGFYFAQGYINVLFLRVGQGICSGLIWPSAQILVSEYSQSTIRTRALSIYQNLGRIGMIASRGLLALVLIIGTKLAFTELENFRLTFLVGSIIIGVAFVQSLAIREKPRKLNIEYQKRKPHSIFFLAFIIGTLLALRPITILYFNEHFGLSPVAIVTILFSVDVGLMITTYIFSHLADNFGIKFSLILILIPCIVAAILLPLIKSLIPFVLVWFVIRTAISSFIPIARSYATGTKKGAGVRIGYLNMATNLGSVCGPVVGGLIYDHLTGGFKISGYSVLALFLIPYIIFTLLKLKE